MKVTEIILLGLIAVCAVPALATDGEGEDTKLEEIASTDEPAAKREVDKKDIKALSEARASKSEEAMVKAASRVLGVDSKNLEALNSLGVFYFEQGKYGLARIIFLRALQDHPDVPALHNNLAILYIAEAKLPKAIAEFRKALEIKSDYRIGAANLGSIFLEYRDLGRALAPIEAGYKAVKADLKAGQSGAIEVANNYAVVLSGTGEAQKAREIYEQLLAGGTRNPTIMLNYAILLVEKLKDMKEGSKQLNRIKFAVDDPKIQKKVDELEEKVNAAEK